MFKTKVYHTADQDAAARSYYRQHRNQLDKAMGTNPYYSNEDIFSDAVKASAAGTIRGSTTMGNIIQGVADAKMGIDPELKRAKKEGENRFAFGFGDLRKLNKRIPDGFKQADIDLASTEHMTGYWEIRNSSVIIVKIRSTQYSSTSPIEIYRYMDRTPLGI